MEKGKRRHFGAAELLNALFRRKNQIKKKKKVSKRCRFDFKQKPLLPLKVAMFFPSQSKHPVQEITHVQQRTMNPSRYCSCSGISRSVDLKDSPDFTASVEGYVAWLQVVQQRTTRPTTRFNTNLN
jgi:hypothetical protein